MSRNKTKKIRIDCETIMKIIKMNILLLLIWFSSFKSFCWLFDEVIDAVWDIKISVSVGSWSVCVIKISVFGYSVIVGFGLIDEVELGMFVAVGFNNGVSVWYDDCVAVGFRFFVAVGFKIGVSVWIIYSDAVGFGLIDEEYRYNLKIYSI